MCFCHKTSFRLKQKKINQNRKFRGTVHCAVSKWFYDNEADMPAVVCDRDTELPPESY